MPMSPIALVGGSARDMDVVRSAFPEASGSTEFAVLAFPTAPPMMSALAQGEIHCILLGAGVGAPDDVLSAVAELDPDMPVVVLGDEMDGPVLLRTVTYAVQSARVRIGLRGLSEHLRNVLDSLTEGVIVRSADGRILTVNATAEQMFGESVADVRDDVYDVMDPDHLFNEDGSRCGMDELPSSIALRTGQPTPAKVICIERRDGSRLWLECSATLLHSEVDGSVSGVVTSLRDLTDRRSAEESLRFRSHLLDAVGQIVIANDAKGVVLYWNAAAEATFGWSSVDALGRYVTDVTSLDVARANEILHAVASGETWTGEVLVRRRDGSEFRALASDTPVFNDAGQLIAIIGVLTDVTSLYEIDESLRLQSALLSAVGQCVVATDIDDRVIYWNAAATREFGWTEQEMLGQDASAKLAHESQLDIARDLEANLRRGESWSGDLLMKRKDGSVFTASVSTSPVLDEDGQVVRFIAVMADVTEQREAEAAMRRWSAIIESTGDAVIGGSLERRIVSWNSAAERLIGYSADEALGQPCEHFIPPDRIDEFHHVFARATEGTITEDLESARLRKDGTVVEVSMTLSPWRDASGRVVGVSTIARDISERRQMERMLEHQALHDTLTGLPNRTLLIDRIGQALVGARRRERQVAMLFIDLENFKALNDSAGHDVGDAVLVEIAERLRVVVRPEDTVARFSGVEFVILCEASHLDAPMALAERLQEVIRSAIEVDGNSFRLAASIGIALSDADCTVESLLRDGEAAMNQAKLNGRGQITLFDAEVHKLAAERLAAPAALRRALDNDEFRVYFQPVLSVRDEKLRGFEALVRWQHPERGFTPPSEFIGLAEESGLIVPLGEHVLRQALTAASAWSLGEDGRLPILSVNLSARQLAETGMAQMIAALIEESGWPASRLALEVTETVIMEDVSHSIESLRALRDIGVRVSIDDFGTGYSSLSYLKQLPVDALKIDQSFVDGLGKDRHDSAIVEAILSLARTLNLYVVAEGVETRVQFEELRRLGCDYAQGFLWAPALTADEAMEWVLRGGPPRVG